MEKEIEKVHDFLYFVDDNLDDPEKVKSAFPAGCDLSTAKPYLTTELVITLARKECEELLKWLVERGLDLNSEEDGAGSPLHECAYSGEVRPARMLLRLGARIDAVDCEDNTPLEVARLEGRPGMICLLENTKVERRFSALVTGGICSEGQFRDFLAEGVCDARILMRVADFAFTQEDFEREKIRKRKDSNK